MDPPVSSEIPHKPSSTPSRTPATCQTHYKASSYTAATTSVNWNGWTISTTKGPILSSQCTCNSHHGEGGSSSRNMDTGHPSASGAGDSKAQEKCAFCRYDPLLKLKYLPDMVFAQNRLVIASPDGSFGIEFSAVDAVNSIRDTPSGDLKVASAGVWQGARSEAIEKYGSEIVKYDWTYTPDYVGTTFGDVFTSEPSTETLNMTLLRRHDPVLLFEELQLYGDELDDNGCAEMDLKIRVVESYLFVLMRFYLRVDHVAVKLQDVRFMFEKGKNFMLRERSLRECKTCHLPVDVSPMEPVQLWSALTPTKTVVEKVSFVSKLV